MKYFSDHIDPSVCPHCKNVIDGFEPVTDATSSSIVEVDETVTCTISFRDYNDQPISIPCAFKISKSINSAKIYEQLTVLLYGGSFFEYFESSKIFSFTKIFFQKYARHPSSSSTIRINRAIVAVDARG